MSHNLKDRSTSFFSDFLFLLQLLSFKPLTKAFSAYFVSISSQGLGWSCFNPKEIFLSLASILNIYASILSPNFLIISENIGKFSDAYYKAKEHISSGKTLDHLKKIQKF